MAAERGDRGAFREEAASESGIRLAGVDVGRVDAGDGGGGGACAGDEDG